MATASFDKVKVKCLENESVVLADVLAKTDKMLRVVLEKTNITLTLTRNDLKKMYIGALHNMEFVSDGQTV